MNKFGGVIVVLISASACANEMAFDDLYASTLTTAIPVCEIKAHPKEYVGREVTVVGFYANSPHQRILYDPTCAPGGLALRIAGDRKSGEADDQMQRVLQVKGPVGIKSIYRGRIQAEQKILGCTENDCLRLSINDAQLVAADNPRRE